MISRGVVVRRPDFESGLRKFDSCRESEEEDGAFLKGKGLWENMARVVR